MVLPAWPRSPDARIHRASGPLGLERWDARHAEGRGVESLQPLARKSRKIGMFSRSWAFQADLMRRVPSRRWRAFSPLAPWLRMVADGGLASVTERERRSICARPQRGARCDPPVAGRSADEGTCAPRIRRDTLRAPRSGWGVEHRCRSRRRSSARPTYDQSSERAGSRGRSTMSTSPAEYSRRPRCTRTSRARSRHHATASFNVRPVGPGRKTPSSDQ